MSIADTKWNTPIDVGACLIYQCFDLCDFANTSVCNKHWRRVSSLHMARLTLSSSCWDLTPLLDRSYLMQVTTMALMFKSKSLVFPSPPLSKLCWCNLENMTSLRSLCTYSTPPRSFFESTVAHGLTELHVNHPENASLTHMTNLQKLVLLAPFGVNLSQLPRNITSLAFSESYFVNLSLSFLLEHLSSLRSLSMHCASVAINDNNNGNKSATNTNLTRLCHVLDHATDQQLLMMAQTPSYFSSLSHLVELHIDFLKLYRMPRSFAHLVAALASVSPNLEHVCLGFDKDRRSFVDIGASIHIADLTQLARLRHLELNGVAFVQSDSQKHIGLLSPFAHCLRALTLFVYEYGNLAVFDAISMLSCLTALHVTFGNHIPPIAETIEFTCSTHSGVWPLLPALRVCITPSYIPDSCHFFKQLFLVHRTNQQLRVVATTPLLTTTPTITTTMTPTTTMTTVRPTLCCEFGRKSNIVAEIVQRHQLTVWSDAFVHCYGDEWKYSDIVIVLHENTGLSVEKDVLPFGFSCNRMARVMRAPTLLHSLPLHKQNR